VIADSPFYLDAALQNDRLPVIAIPESIRPVAFMQQAQNIDTKGFAATTLLSIIVHVP
jgi:hypothetical protein